MIIKLLVNNNNNKLIYNNFYINKVNNKIIINSLNNLSKKLVPIYNIYNYLTFYSISFPLELLIIDDCIFNPYIILSSYNFDIDNNIDFFYQIKQKILEIYNLSFYNFDYLINNNFFEIINNNYNFNIIDNINNNNIIWNTINIIKLYVILISINKNYNYNNKFIEKIYNIIKLYKYNLISEKNNNLMTFDEYYYDNVTLSLNNLLLNYDYFIVNKLNKICKITILVKNNNIITINNEINIIYENYKWYNNNPEIIINKEYVIFNTFLNNNFTNEILRIIFNYYIDNNKYIYIDKIYSDNNNFENKEKLKELEELFITNINNFNNNLNLLNYINLEIKETNTNNELLICINKLIIHNFDKNIFQKIIEKYNYNYFLKILEFLFNNYNYPLKINRIEIDVIFDYILYISLYNFDLIFIDNILNVDINNILPLKLKYLYINILKILIQIINNNFELVTFNKKIYNDYIYKNIIFILFTNSDKLFINYLKNKLSLEIFNKFKSIIINNFILLDISNKLTWNNLPKKLNYLSLFYINKFNKNILSDSFDLKIQKIIVNPFFMYNYLKKEADFIKWTNFINFKIIDIYYITITLINKDYVLIGKLIYLLFNINEQSINDKYYLNFLNFCNENNKIILYDNRINIKIKELFSNIKCSLNLGILAKHLTWNKNIIVLENNSSEDELITVKNKLEIINIKYLKYKKKYMKYKNNYIFNTIIN